MLVTPGGTVKLCHPLVKLKGVHVGKMVTVAVAEAVLAQPSGPADAVSVSVELPGDQVPLS
jgi:hypothetical protein